VKRYDLSTGMEINYPSAIPALTTAQRDRCYLGVAEAHALLDAMDKGAQYFTAFSVGCFKETLDPLVELGLLTKHKSQKTNGWYYRPIPKLTRVWCLTALAMRDERVSKQNHNNSPNGAEG